MSYEVLIDSLPLDLQLRTYPPQITVEDPLSPSAEVLQTAEWWAYFLRTALASPKGSQERVAAMRALADVETMGPDGRPFTPSMRDIERKVSKATIGGIGGRTRTQTR